MGDVAALLGGADELLDRRIGEVEQWAVRQGSRKETGPQQRRSTVVRLAVSAGSDNAYGIGGRQPGNGDPLAARRLPSLVCTRNSDSEVVVMQSTEETM